MNDSALPQFCSVILLILGGRGEVGCVDDALVAVEYFCIPIDASMTVSPPFARRMKAASVE